MVRQILGAVSEFEKAGLVAKLKGARDRKRKTGVKVEGRKIMPSVRQKPSPLRSAWRYHAKGHQRSLRDIAAELAAQGHVNTSRKPYEASAIARMIAKAA